jgi:hypothetical protein
MCPNSTNGPFRTDAEQPEGDDRRPAAIDYSQARFTAASRRKLRRTKKPLPPAGFHKRHNKRWSW